MQRPTMYYTCPNHTILYESNQEGITIDSLL